jgi:hypothetical protein
VLPTEKFRACIRAPAQSLCANLEKAAKGDHFWGNLQAITPTLLEICGPLFMSYPAISNVQYRFTEEKGITRLKFTHRAMGQIAHDAQIERGWAQIEGGWDNLMARIRSAAAQSRSN